MKKAASLLGSRRLQAFAARHAFGIPSRKVRVCHRSGLRLARFPWAQLDETGVYGAYTVMGEEFGKECIHHLNVDHEAFWGFCGTSLEALRHERRRGTKTIVEQVDLARQYEETRREECPPLLFKPAPSAYFERLQAEWDAARLVVVNSIFCRDAIVAQGVDIHKVRVIPLMYDCHGTRTMMRRWRPAGPLRVLWVGALSHTKGIRYALEAALMLKEYPVEFTFAGRPITGLDQICVRAPNVTFLGSIPRNDLPEVYSTHDVLLFPTLCDGFGIVQLEAMSYGLPVIATNCCGSVVDDGSSGFVIPSRNANAIAEKVVALVDDRPRLAAMSAAALKRVECYASERIWPSIAAVLQE